MWAGCENRALERFSDSGDGSSLMFSGLRKPAITGCWYIEYSLSWTSNDRCWRSAAPATDCAHLEHDAGRLQSPIVRQKPRNKPPLSTSVPRDVLEATHSASQISWLVSLSQPPSVNCYVAAAIASGSSYNSEYEQSKLITRVRTKAYHQCKHSLSAE